MADIKITALPATSALTDDDLLLTVDAPGGGAATKKIVVADAKAQLRVGDIRPIGFQLNDGGGVIQTGAKVDLYMWEAGNIANWVAGSDTNAGLCMEVWKSNSYPPTVAGRIFAIGWSGAVSGAGAPAAAVAVGDWLRIMLVQNSNATRVPVFMKLSRT